MPCRVKICGITRVKDAENAVAAGADAIGLVFYGPSPRAVTSEQAAAIAKSVGPFVTVVGLFVNPSEALVRRTLEQVDLHILQFHGDEPEAFCQQFQRPYMKALRMRPELNVEDEASRYPSAVAILLDAYRKGVPGGTGESFDWRRVPRNPETPIVLAGGLRPDNIAEAVATTNVYGVDVSGGVESEPGLKSLELIRAFMGNANGQ